METYEESVELTRTFVKIESTNPGTEEAAMREAILAYLKDTSCEIQLDDVGNGRKCHPGQDYQCRCCAIPVFDIDNLDLPV